MFLWHLGPTGILNYLRHAHCCAHILERPCAMLFTSSLRLRAFRRLFSEIIFEFCFQNNLGSNKWSCCRFDTQIRERNQDSTIGFEYKATTWYANGFPNGGNLGSIV